MTYVLGDDKTYRNVALRECGAMAALLYTVALYECAQVDGDGVLTPMMVKDAAGLYDIPARAKHAAALVTRGLWHDEATLAACDECSERTESLPSGAVLIHRWWDPLLHQAGKEDPIKRQREVRRKALNRDKKLVAKIRNRDKDLCRYCGVACADSSGPDKKSPTVRTLDHIDPWGANTEANVVVACKTCNGWKNQRTPEQWLEESGPWSPENPGGARPLMRPGARSDRSGLDPAQHPADPAPAQIEDPAPVRSAREAGPGRFGPGQHGSGSGPETDRVPAHATNGHSNGSGSHL